MYRTILIWRGRRRDVAIVAAWVVVCLVASCSGQDFRIDNQVRIQANDCYTRIAIGSRMPDSTITSTIPANSLSDCEAACSGNRSVCNAFSFGIDARGNGTCRIGRIDLNTRGNDLAMDPDYDVYERRAKMPRGCQHDRLLTIGFGARAPITNASAANNTALSRQQIGPPANGQPVTPPTTTTMMMMMNGAAAPAARRPQTTFGNPFASGAFPGNDSPASRDPSFFRGGWNPPIADDDDTRVYDIINNKKNYKSSRWRPKHQHHESPHELYSEEHLAELHSHVEIHEEDEVHGHGDDEHYLYRSSPLGSAIENKWSLGGAPGAEPKWSGVANPGGSPKWIARIPGLNPKWTASVQGSNPNKWSEAGFGDFGVKLQAGYSDGVQRGISSYSTSTIAPGFGTRGLFDFGVGAGYPPGATVDPVLEKTKACYRKLLSGRRLADGHVRRNVQCSRIEECHRVCEYETTFVCEGFNYGRLQDAPGVGRYGDRPYMCQLTSLSGARMDPRRDFVQDPRWDYYERDWRCPAEKPGQSGGGGGGGDWSTGPQRPHWHPPPPLPSPPRRPPNEIPRPSQRPNDRYPGGATSPGTNTHYYYPEKPRPPHDRPNDYDYYPGSPSYQPQRPQRPQTDVYHYHRPPQASQPHQGIPYLPNPNYYYSGGDPTRPGTFSKYPDRRIDQTGWHRPQQDARPNEVVPDRDWRRPNGHYLPNKDWPDSDVYGASYGYDSNRYDGRFPDRQQPPRRPDDLYPVDDDKRLSKPARRPGNQQHYYGYHYGPAYGYDANGHHGQQADSYVPSWKPQHPTQPWIGPGSWGGSRDCSVRSATGFKVTRRIVDASYTAGNLEECEMLCATRGDCRSFAYRYSLAATAPTDNCLLSVIHFSKLNFYTDLEPDRDYDIYAIIGDPRNCQGSGKPGAEVRPHHRLPEECFWRVRSGFGIPVSLTRKELRVENGLGECQVACVSARHFTCRSFVFRYESDRDRGPNCFLSDCPTSEIIPGEGAGLPRVDQAELYERGSYGRGCEPYPFATLYNPANLEKSKPWTRGGNRPGNRGDEACYSGYQGGCRLSPYAVSAITRVDSETECRRKCSRMRNHPHSPCMSFSFKIGDEKRGDNCYLSDVPRKDLRPGLDYVYDDDYVMYAWKELEPQCSFGPAGGYPHYENSASVGAGSWPGGNSPEARPPHIGPGTGLLSFNHLILGVRPLDPDRPDPIGPPDYSSHSGAAPHGDDDGYSPGFGPSYGADGFASFNRHYTVNGLPCKRGTRCERNEIAGFWSCEPEGAEIGSWDYCCEPNHHCGFSQGYRYPWCYVGPSEDQWRPCSDRYFPYLPSPRPAVRPPVRNNDDDSRRPSHRPPDRPLGNADSATYHSRHWPIAFLHPQPPPNATDSVALADDRRDDPQRATNTSKEHKSSKDNETPSVPPPPAAAMTDSPITRLQLHKSHLKRRGLVTANNATTRLSSSKNAIKKIRRITIIPADKENAGRTSRAKYSSEKSPDSSYPNATKAPINGDDDFHVVHLGANLRDVGSSAERRKTIAGRVERVARPAARTMSIELATRGGQENSSTAPTVSSDSTDRKRRPVYVPVALTTHRSDST